MTSVAATPTMREPRSRAEFRLQFYARAKVEGYRRRKLLCWWRYREELLRNGRSEMSQNLFAMAIDYAYLAANVHWAWEAPR